MTVSLGEVKFEVLTIINKTAANKGFYTDEKMEAGVRDGLAMIGTEMFIGGQGWQDKVRAIYVEAGAVSVDVPKDITFINQLRYASGDETFYPMMYDTQRGTIQLQPGNGVNQNPPTYRILNNAIYFNSAQGGQLQIEYTTYLRNMESDADVLPPNMDLSMLRFLIYHVCSFCVASVGKADPEWNRWENYWYQQMQKIIVKRNNQMAYLRDFD